jgi:hypothetical protein
MSITTLYTDHRPALTHTQKRNQTSTNHRRKSSFSTTRENKTPKKKNKTKHELLNRSVLLQSSTTTTKGGERERGEGGYRKENPDQQKPQSSGSTSRIASGPLDSAESELASGAGPPEGLDLVPDRPAIRPCTRSSPGGEAWGPWVATSRTSMPVRPVDLSLFLFCSPWGGWLSSSC